MKILAFVIGIPGVLAALLALLPRVTPTLSEPVDPDNPFSSSVTITNTGYIPLNNVMPVMSGGQIVTKGKLPDLNWIPTYETRVQKAEWVPRDMAIDDRFTFALNDLWDTKERGGLEYADLAVIIQYEVPVIHLKREKIFPFVTHRQTNGRLYWYSKLVEPKPN